MTTAVPPGAFDGPDAGDEPDGPHAFLTPAQRALVADHFPDLIEAEGLLDEYATALPLSSAIDYPAAIALLKQVELLRRKMEAVTAKTVRTACTQFDGELAGERTLEKLMRRELRISDGEAKRRSQLSEHITAHTSLSGGQVPPRLPAIAASLEAGDISLDQTDAIIKQLDLIPEDLRAEHEADAEELLVRHAPRLDIKSFPVAGQRIRDWIDPDGRWAPEPTDPRKYSVTLRQKRNGDWLLRGLLESTVGLELNALLTNRSKSPTEIMEAAGPEPVAGPEAVAGTEEASGGERADRTGKDHGLAESLAGLGHLDQFGQSQGPPPESGQTCWDPRPDGARRHDRFAHLIRCGAARQIGAGSYALVVTATAEQLARGRGEVNAAGGITRLEDVLRLSPAGRFYYESRRPGTRDVDVRTESRFASSRQLDLLKARDRGCTFPDCDVPVGWCDAHHMVPHRDGGPTDLTNLTLVCRFHHRWHERHGWRCAYIDDLPAWIPPTGIDPEQRPRFHSRFTVDLREAASLFDTAVDAEAPEPPPPTYEAPPHEAPRPTDRTSHPTDQAPPSTDQASPTTDQASRARRRPGPPAEQHSGPLEAAASGSPPPGEPETSERPPRTPQWGDPPPDRLPPHRPDRDSAVPPPLQGWGGTSPLQGWGGTPHTWGQAPTHRTDTHRTEDRSSGDEDGGQPDDEPG